MPIVVDDLESTYTAGFHARSKRHIELKYFYTNGSRANSANNHYAETIAIWRDARIVLCHVASVTVCIGRSKVYIAVKFHGCQFEVSHARYI